MSRGALPRASSLKPWIPSLPSDLSLIRTCRPLTSVCVSRPFVQGASPLSVTLNTLSVLIDTRLSFVQVQFTLIHDSSLFHSCNSLL